jgi:hypothetical protein
MGNLQPFENHLSIDYSILYFNHGFYFKKIPSPHKKFVQGWEQNTLIIFERQLVGHIKTFKDIFTLSVLSFTPKHVLRKEADGVGRAGPTFLCREHHLLLILKALFALRNPCLTHSLCV